jgi:replicative DNA helicase
MKRSLIYNFLAEKAVLSTLLKNPDLIEKTKLSLPIEAFYYQNHQELYRSMVALYNNNHKIDLILLTSFLQDNGLIDKVGGLKLVQELIEQSSDSDHLSEYLELIKDKFLRRSVIRLGYELINTGYMTNVNIKTSIFTVEERLQILKDQLNIYSTFSNALLLEKIFSELKKKSISPELAGLSSGLSDLDSLTQGFQKSDLIIVAGRPSVGKTAFVLNITANILKYSKLPVLFFSLEMSREQILYRLISIETTIEQIHLKIGNLNKNDWTKLNRVLEIIKKLPLFVDDNPKISMSYIRSRIKEIFSNQGKIGLVVIDYLQLIQNNKLGSDNRVQELSFVTRSLKIMAREFNLPIIVLSQLNRNIENRSDKKPLLSDLRESGSIEQDADLILILYNDIQSNKDYKLTNLIVAKHRNGPTGMIELKFDPKYNQFLNQS